MIKIAIIDEQKSQIELFQLLVNEYFANEIEVVCSFTNPNDAYKLIKNYSIDILFCNADLPEINGLELLDLLTPYSFKVIMLSHNETYALGALKRHVFDYLIHPINVLAISESIKKYKEVSKISYKSAFIQDTFEDKLIVNGHEKVVVISIKEIIRLEASGAYTTIFYETDKSLTSSKPIKFFEQILEKKGFHKIQ